MIQRIHIQEKINIAYDPQALQLNKYHPTPAAFKSVKLGTVLDRLLINTGITYEDSGTAIVLSPKTTNLSSIKKEL